MRSVLALAVLSLLACKEEPTAAPDAGKPDVTDHCDSASEAGASADCALPLDGTKRQGYVAPLDDVDWWAIDVPSPLPARALLTVRAQYDAPSTPVTLSMNVVKADGATSVGAGIDRKLRGGPGPVEVTARLTEGGRYFVLLRHATSEDDPAYDDTNGYEVSATLTTDPDTHEPNDALATPVNLPPCGTVKIEGALATAGDVDRYTFDVGACSGGRTLLVLRATAPKASLAELRLEYHLNGPTGPVTSDHAPSPFGVQSMSTARIVQPGKHELVVNAYKPQGSLDVPPGDPSFTYSFELALYADVDANEGTTGNDTTATATQVPLTSGQSRVFTGRLSYVGDVDLFALNLGASTKPMRVGYKLTVSSAAGRFAPIPTLQPKELTVVSQAATAGDCKANCPGGSVQPGSDWCNKGQCLWQRRLEVPALNFGNFQGMLLVPPNGPSTVFVQVDYVGAAGADDKEYDLTVQYLPETADEATALHDTRATAIAGTAPASVTTALGYGHGSPTPSIDRAPNGLPLIPRGPGDYDAQADQDFVEVRFTPTPRPPPDGGVDSGPNAEDLALDLGWAIPPAGGQRAGERSYDVSLKLHFCDKPDCSTTVETAGYLGYKSSAGSVWYGDKVDGGMPPQKGWDVDGAGNFKARPGACLCIDGKYAEAGKFWIETRADNRASYADDDVTVKANVAPYTVTFTDDSGKARTCPTPCQFVERSKK